MVTMRDNKELKNEKVLKIQNPYIIINFHTKFNRKREKRGLQIEHNYYIEGPKVSKIS